jgi:hypothetical protein
MAYKLFGRETVVAKKEKYKKSILATQELYVKRNKSSIKI